MPYEYYAPIDFECGCRINCATHLTHKYVINVTSKSYIEDTICAKHELEMKEKFLKGLEEHNIRELREAKKSFKKDRKPAQVVRELPSSVGEGYLNKSVDYEEDEEITGLS